MAIWMGDLSFFRALRAPKKLEFTRPHRQYRSGDIPQYVKTIKQFSTIRVSLDINYLANQKYDFDEFKLILWVPKAPKK